MHRNAVVVLLAVVSVCGLAVGCAEEAQDAKALEAPQTELAPSKVAAADGVTAYQGVLELETRVSASFDKRTAHHVWSLELVAGAEVFVDAASRAGDDLFVLLYQARGDRPGYDLVDYNDDCYQGTLNSCATLLAPASAEYLVVVSTFGYLVENRRTAASYDLLVSCQNGACGAPAPTGQACGSRGLAPCPTGTYCDFDTDDTADACGATDRPGVCAAVPQICTREYFPVCGCDGVTYGNACSAAAAGADVSYTGECQVQPPEGQTCGGIAALQCAEGQVCDYSGNEGCFPDMAGVCVTPRDIACTLHYDPVCGCDGQTYGNACAAAAAYVSVAHAGECP